MNHPTITITIASNGFILDIDRNHGPLSMLDEIGDKISQINRQHNEGEAWKELKQIAERPPKKPNHERFVFLRYKDLEECIKEVLHEVDKPF